MAELPFATAAPVDAEQPRSKETGKRPFAGVRTFTQVGKEERPFAASPEATLADQKGSGHLDHMWFGGSFPHFTDLRIRMYVDGEAKPSIDMLLGMGVGVGFGDPAAPWGTRFNGITGAPSGIFINYPVPFSRHIRVTAELPEGVQRDTVFWWIVRGVENLPLRISGLEIPGSARLRLYRRDDQRVAPLEEFELCRAAGSGMIFQVTMAARSSNFEFMEGQMRAYMGASQEPQFLSSGLEDYFLGTYYFNRGLYHLPQAGLTHKDATDSSFSAYRFHDIDPVFFSDGIRLTCRCGEKRGDKVFGTTGHPQPTTYTTYVWTYGW
jgi:hypothetical protein